jgi:hypothetical protein
MKWLKRIWQRLFRKKQAQVVVHVSDDLLKLYLHLATREGFTLEEWARRALNAAIPQREMRKLTAGTLRAAGIDAAFDQLDRDEAMMPNLLSLSPPAPPRPNRVAAVPGHPCVHLRAEYPTGYSAATCQGSCSHPSQDGRICHWTAAVAVQCPVFEPRFKLPLAAQRS